MITFKPNGPLQGHVFEYSLSTPDILPNKINLNENRKSDINNQLDIIEINSESQVLNIEKWVPGFEEKILLNSLNTLNGTEWLNDEIINTAFDIIKNNASSFNIGCLYDYEIQSMFRNRPSTLWHLELPINTYNKIIIPAHVSRNHWICIGIEINSRNINIFDSNNKSNPPKIMQRNFNYADKVRKVLRANATLSNLNNYEDWVITEIFNLPKQENGSDCGVFSILYAQCFVLNCEMNFSQNDMPLIRNNIKYILENYSSIADKNFLQVHNNLNNDNHSYIIVDALRKQMYRDNENNTERSQRLLEQKNRQDNIRKIKKEKLPPLYKKAEVWLNVDKMQFKNNKIDIKCKHCKSKHFIEELTQENYRKKNLSFEKCCHHGKIVLEKLPEYPLIFKELMTKKHKKSRIYHDRIRRLNSAVSFASMNPIREKFAKNRQRGPYCFRIHGQITHKINAALFPDENEKPQWGQLYLIDPSEATNIRACNNPDLERELLELLGNVIKNESPHAEALNMMVDEYNKHEQMAKEHNLEMPNIALKFSGKKRT